MTLNTSNVMAAEWSITPTVAFGGEVNDNISLSTTDPNEVTGSTVTPEARLSRVNPNSATSVGARAQFTQYSDDEIRDTDVQYLTFDSRYKSQQRSTWRINGQLKRDTTITSVRNADELIDESIIDGNTGEAVDTDAGLVQVEVRRNRLNLDPSWQRELTERTSLRLGYSLLDVSFEDADASGLVDYRTHTLDTTLSRKLTERDNMGMSVEVSQYSSPDDDTETENISLYASYNRVFGEIFRGHAAAGYRDTTVTTGSVEDKSGGIVIDLGINKRQTTLTSYDISLKHDISPSGTGRVVKSDQIRVRLKSRLTPRLSATLRGSAFDNTTLLGNISNNDRVYYSIEPGLRWLMTREWAINTSYRYRKQKRELESDAAESNAFYVSIDYTWSKLAVSR